MTNTDKRAGWERMPGTHDVDSGKGKVYRGLVRFERLCATCGVPFGIYVTQGTADGETRNSSFGLRNCEKHRLKMIAPGIGMPADEAEKLRTANATMKEELTGLYAQIKELHIENEALKSKLATYELPGVPAAKPLNGAASGELLQNWLAKNKSKMPWE